MNDFKPVRPGLVSCTTEVVNRGKSLAHLESRLYCGEALVATANGNYAIIAAPKKD
ncbi:MAG TPA: hypothetical protein VF262_06110 [Burkholderiales bacterium]